MEDKAAEVVTTPVDAGVREITLRVQVDSEVRDIKLKIDPEFETLIPRITDEEYRDLIKNIEQDGCRDPLVVWKETGILLDGHHRLEICENINAGHPGYPIFPKVEELEFSDRAAAKIWIIENQFGRRNLSTAQRAMLGDKLTKLYAEPAKERQGARTDIVTNLERGEEFGRSVEKAAKAVGVSPQTIASAGKVAKAGIPQLQEMMGKETLVVSAAAEVATHPPEVQKVVVEKIKEIADERAASGKQSRVTGTEVKEIIQEVAPPEAPTSTDENLVKVERKLQGVMNSLNSFETTTQPEKLVELIALSDKIIARIKAIGLKSTVPGTTVVNRVTGDHQLEIDAETLRAVLESTVGEDGIKLYFQDDGMRIFGRDSGGYMASSVFLPKDRFTKYEIEPSEICVRSVEDLQGHRWRSKGARAQIFIEPIGDKPESPWEERYMHICYVEADGATREYKVRLTHPESIHEPPKIPEFNPTCKVVMAVSGREFVKTLQDHKSGGEIALSVVDSSLKIDTFHAKSCTSSPVTLMIPCKVLEDGPANSRFGTAFFVSDENVRNTINRSDSITLSLGVDLPLVMDLEVYGIPVRYIIAPRTSSD